MSSVPGDGGHSDAVPLHLLPLTCVCVCVFPVVAAAIAVIQAPGS